MANAMNWETASEKAEELSQGLIIKLKDKQEIEGVFCGEPVMDRKHFFDNKPTECIGLPHCVLCQNGQKPSVSWFINFAARTKDGYTMRIMRFSTTKFNQLNIMRNKLKAAFATQLFSITREGIEMDTDYIIMPLGEAPGLDLIKGLELNDIVEFTEKAMKRDDAR